jgi:hypothetical protein
MAAATAAAGLAGNFPGMVYGDFSAEPVQMVDESVIVSKICAVGCRHA